MVPPDALQCYSETLASHYLKVIRPGARRPHLISSVSSAVDEAAGLALSVTVNVSFVFCGAAVGVPLMLPVLASRVSPAGRTGVTVQFSGAVPPVASSLAE